MPSALRAAEAEWLAQLATMRKEIQDLKLDQQLPDSSSFEDGISITDDELLRGTGDDIWDITDDEDDDDYSSDSLEQPEVQSGCITDGPEPGSRDSTWLKSKSVWFAHKNPGLSSSDFEAQIRALLASDMQGVWLSFDDTGRNCLPLNR